MRADPTPAALAKRARALDAADPLAQWRRQFRLPPGLAYFDGNSLGPPTRAGLARLRQVAEQEWAGRLISAWNDCGWIAQPGRLGAKLAPLIGAEPGEVLVADSTSINLFKVLAAASALRPGRRRLLIQTELFPSDLYIADALAAWSGRFTVERCPTAEVAQRLDDDVAAICLGQVDYRSGELYDLEGLTAAAHHHGALALWDLCHSAGALPIAANKAGVDLAVGCTYKFLNGGPGAPAFVYLARRHQELARQPLEGWLGHGRPFEFAADYQPAAGIDRFQCGTPPILALAALDSALDLFAQVDLGAVRQKSLDLGDFFLTCLGGETELELITPRDPSRRGSQLTFLHLEALPLVNCLRSQGIVADFRHPDLLRFGLAPLYLRYIDVARAADRLKAILAEGRHRDPAFQQRQKVT